MIKYDIVKEIHFSYLLKDKHYLDRRGGPEEQNSRLREPHRGLEVCDS